MSPQAPGLFLSWPEPRVLRPPSLQWSEILSQYSRSSWRKVRCRKGSARTRLRLRRSSTMGSKNSREVGPATADRYVLGRCGGVGVLPDRRPGIGSTLVIRRRPHRRAWPSASARTSLETRTRPLVPLGSETKLDLIVADAAGVPVPDAHPVLT